MDPLVGIDEARARVRGVVSGYDGRSLTLLLVDGPPGSGKTTLVERELAEFGYAAYRPSSEESSLRETALIVQFCRYSASLDALKPSAPRRRAVFLDDSLGAAKAIAKVYDALKAGGCRALVIACVGRSEKAQEARRRASHSVSLRYPSVEATAECVFRAMRGEVTEAAAERCSRAAGGCVPKAMQLAAGETYGCEARESARGVDTTIFDDVARGMGYALAGRSFHDVDAAISCEPFMCAMIVRESARGGPSGPTREAFRALSKTGSGTPMGRFMSTAAFAEACLRERGALGGPLRFPRCYTTTSSRTLNVRKQQQRARQDDDG